MRSSLIIKSVFLITRALLVSACFRLIYQSRALGSWCGFEANSVGACERSASHCCCHCRRSQPATVLACVAQAKKAKIWKPTPLKCVRSSVVTSNSRDELSQDACGSDNEGDAKMSVAASCAASSSCSVRCPLDCHDSALKSRALHHRLLRRVR